MTPARQPHPQSDDPFVIIRSQMLELTKCCHSELLDILEDVYEHPATHTPAAPAALFQIEPNSNKYSLEQIVEINENIQKQCKDAAKAAREQVLDELLQWLEGHWTLTMVKHYGALTTQQSLEYKTTINKIKSLRGGAP